MFVKLLKIEVDTLCLKDCPSHRLLRSEWGCELWSSLLRNSGAIDAHCQTENQLMKVDNDVWSFERAIEENKVWYAAFKMVSCLYLFAICLKIWFLHPSKLFFHFPFPFRHGESKNVSIVRKIAFDVVERDHWEESQGRKPLSRCQSRKPPKDVEWR